VLLNLVGNGVKFTEAGTISIRARVLETTSTGQRIEIVVSDTGIGISPEDQDRLFQPFVQADAPGSRNRGGTGLGLAISRRLAELMNGSLMLASETGRGTTVTLSLAFDFVSPAAADAQPVRGAALPLLPPSSHRAGAERRRILVVDDNEFNRAVLARQVAALGYEAEQASDGEEALHLLAQRSYALVLADCQMPGMDGFEFARSVRRSEAEAGAGEHIPIVAWTANVMPDDVAACRDAGMDDVLAKPSALPTVQRALRTWVDRASETEAPSAGTAIPAPSYDGAPIDRMQLRAIMDGDAALEAEMLAGFRTASVKEAAALRDALARHDCTAIRHASHRMKGLARLVAASSLAAVCERLERQARAGSVDDPALVLAEFEREWHRVSDFLNAATPT